MDRPGEHVLPSSLASASVSSWDAVDAPERMFMRARDMQWSTFWRLVFEPTNSDRVTEFPCRTLHIDFGEHTFNSLW